MNHSETRKALQCALDILHEIDTKLYVAEGDGAPSDVHRQIEIALLAGHAAEKLLLSAALAPAV